MLLRVEQLMDAAPDSALTLLSDFKDSARAEGEATQMYYQLLTVKANDKCYIPHTADSLMKVLVSYYEDQGTPAQLMEAYYYERKKKQQLIEQGRRLHFFEELCHKESLEQIEQNNKQIASLKEQLILVREQNDLVKEKLLTIKTR